MEIAAIKTQRDYRRILGQSSQHTIPDRSTLGVRNGPGSAAHHAKPRAALRPGNTALARDTRVDRREEMPGTTADAGPILCRRAGRRPGILARTKPTQERSGISMVRSRVCSQRRKSPDLHQSMPVRVPGAPS